MRPTSRFLRSARWLAATLLVVGLGACDVSTDLDDFQIILQVDDLPVSLGSGVTAQVSPTRPTAATTTVSSDFDVTSVNDLESITLRPRMFAFTPGAAPRGAGSGAASGTITGYVFIGGYPVPGTPVVLTVTDGVVTAVSPETIGTAASAIDEADIEAFLASLPASERPDLEAWGALTIAEVRDRIRGILSASSFPLSFGLEVASSDPLDPLTGSITLNEIDISAVITR